MERTCSKETDQVDARWLLVVCAFPHMCVEKSEDTTRKRDRLHNPGFQGKEKKVSEPLAVKTCGGLWQQEKLPVSQDSPLEGPTGS